MRPNTTEVEMQDHRGYMRSQVSGQSAWKGLRERRLASAISCLLAGLWLLTGSSALAQGDKDSLHSHVPGVDETVTFTSGSTWELRVGSVGIFPGFVPAGLPQLQKFGLVISHARFKKSPSSPPVTVLFDGRLGEIYTVYHDNSDRFPDISVFSNGSIPLTNRHCRPPAQIIGDGTICKEKRTHLAWTSGFGAELVRHGEEVVYWSLLHAFNYNYVMEWTFHDDRTIRTRAGSTGARYPPHPTIGHTHDFTWRLDIDLDGPDGDSVHATKHVEANLDTCPNCSTATDSSTLIRTERGLAWNAAQFNTLEVTDKALANSNGRATSYELVRCAAAPHATANPIRRGTFGSPFSAGLPRNSLRCPCLATLPMGNQLSIEISSSGTRAQLNMSRTAG